MNTDFKNTQFFAKKEKIPIFAHFKGMQKNCVCDNSIGFRRFLKLVIKCDLSPSFKRLDLYIFLKQTFWKRNSYKFIYVIKTC